MVKFCKSCGKELDSTSTTVCADCGNKAVKAGAFCRYCGGITGPEDLVCHTCGAALKPTPASVRLQNPDHVKLMRLGKIINLSMVAVLVAAYVIFSLPKSITKPIKAATSDAVLATTGYTATPLYSISSVPSKIPLGNPISQMEIFDIFWQPVIIDAFEPNDVRPLTIYSTYSTNTSGSGSANFHNITPDCVYKSNNTSVVTVDAGGLLTAVQDGRTSVTVSYSAAPGSTNRTASAIGKQPVTISINVSVLVTTVPLRMGGRTTQWPDGVPPQ